MTSKPAQSESALLADIRLALGKDARCVMWRNNSGKFLADFGAAGMRPVSTGLVVGASDLVGMVAPSGRWVALEVKTATGRIRPDQVQFLALVNRYGGFGVVVRSAAEAESAVDAAARGEAAPEVK